MNYVFILVIICSIILVGTCYEENFIATGFGAYLAIPLIREKWNPRMSEGEARQLLEDCLRVLFYRYLILTLSTDFTLLTLHKIHLFLKGLSRIESNPNS